MSEPIKGWYRFILTFAFCAAIVNATLLIGAGAILNKEVWKNQGAIFSVPIIFFGLVPIAFACTLWAIWSIRDIRRRLASKNKRSP